MSFPVILAFNFSMGNTVLCDRYYQNKTDNIIAEEGYIFKRKACYNPLMYDDIEKEIIFVKPQIVVITTEENDTGYFHSDFLPDHLPKLGYKELATYKNKTVNMSIYVKKNTLGYKVVDYDYGTDGNTVHYVIQYLQTPLGYIAMVGFDRTSPEEITINAMNRSVENLLKITVDKSNAFASIVMGNMNNNNNLIENHDYIAIYKNEQPSKYNVIQSKGWIAPPVLKSHVQKITFNMQKPKIMCFSWNTDKTALCDKYHPEKKIHHREKYFQETPCYSPDFFKKLYDKNIVKASYIEYEPAINQQGDDIIDYNEKDIIYDNEQDNNIIYDNEQDNNLVNDYVQDEFIEDQVKYKQKKVYYDMDVSIKAQQPDIVVITTEGDLESGTFFHYEFLRKHMIYYTLLDNEKVTGIGEDDNNYALRMSIYVRNDVVNNTHLTHNGLFTRNVSTCTLKTNKPLKNGVFVLKNNAKALVKFVNTKYGVFAFMGLQIPHEFNVNNRNDCLTQFVNKLNKVKDVDYTFIMGDFSENIPADNLDTYGRTGKTNLKHMFDYYPKGHENTVASDYYQEGNDDRLIPNYKFNQLTISQRDNFNKHKNTYNKDLYGKEVGFHDRIFHATTNATSFEIKCIHYESIFGYPMLDNNTRSQHIGVMGLYGLEKVTMEKNDYGF